MNSPVTRVPEFLPGQAAAHLSLQTVHCRELSEAEIQV